MSGEVGDARKRLAVTTSGRCGVCGNTVTDTAALQQARAEGWAEGHLRGLADADLQHAADNPHSVAGGES